MNPLPGVRLIRGRTRDGRVTAGWEITEDGVNHAPDFDLVLRRAGT